LLIYSSMMSPGNISTEQFLYKLIIDKGVHDTVPNVVIVLRMYLVLMVTNCSAERSFSKLKLKIASEHP